MTSRTPPPTSLSGDLARHRRERAVRAVFLLAGLASIAISVAIILSLVGEAWNFLAGLVAKGELGKLWTVGWFPRRGLYDIPTIVIATVLISLVGMVVAVPLGLGTATFLSEYAAPRQRRWMKPTIEILAGIPSVVLGFWTLSFVGPQIVRRLFPAAGAFSMLAAGIGVGILVTPLVATVSEDAMRAVPRSLRAASYGLGADKATTVRKVVVPAALSGIVAATILALSRALGETMIVFMAAGAVGGSLRTFDLLGPGQTMTAAVAALATGSDQVAGVGLAFQSLFFVGLLLFFLTLGMNWLSTRFVRRFRERYR